MQLGYGSSSKDIQWGFQEIEALKHVTA